MQTKRYPHDDRYSITDAGIVISHCNINHVGPMELKLKTYPTGYLACKIKGKIRYVHRLVLETFIGPCPDGMWARHLNSIKSDNRLENLEWNTPAINIQDKWR